MLVLNKQNLSTSYVSTREFRKDVKFNWGKTIVLAGNELKAIRNNKSLLLNAFFNPVLYLVFFMAGLRGLTGNVKVAGGIEIDFLIFTLPGIFMMLTIGLMGHTVYRSTIDKRWGLLGYKFMNGISPLSYICGLMVYPFLVYIGQILLLAGMSLFYGIQYSLLGLVLALSIGLTALIFWCCLGIVITTRVNDYHQRDMVMGLIQLPLLFTAPTFYAIESAPSYIQVIAWFNPLTYQVTAMRSLFIEQANIFMIGITVTLSIVSLIIAVLLIKNAKLVSKEH